MQQAARRAQMLMNFAIWTIVDSSQVMVEAFFGCKLSSCSSVSMKIDQLLAFFILSHDAWPTHDFNTCVNYFSGRCTGMNRDAYVI